ncbi:MAG: DUF1444 family protein [Planctomycetaceae bacterium]
MTTINSISAGTGVPTDFLPWVHPKKRLCIDVPAGWHCHRQPGEDLMLQLQFHPVDDRRTSFTVAGVSHGISIRSPDDYRKAFESLLRSLHASSSISGRVNSSAAQPQVALNMQYPAFTYQGHSGSPSWAFVSNDSFISLGGNCRAEQVAAFRPIFEQMASSFRIADSLDGRLSVLRAQVFNEFTRSHPTAGCCRRGNQLNLGPMQIFVENLMSQIDAEPQKRQRLIQQFVRTMLKVSQQSQTLGHETWQSVQKLVYPQIRPAAFINAALHAQPGPDQPRPMMSRQQQLAAAPWLADLVICYAIDAPDTLRFVLNSDLERWNMDQQALHTQAMFNLRQISGLKLTGATAADGKFSFAIPGDGQIPVKSTWLLHPLLFRHLQPHLSGPILAAVPGRDTLMFFSGGDLDRQQLKGTIGKSYQSSHHPISDRLFQITPDGIVLA